MLNSKTKKEENFKLLVFFHSKVVPDNQYNKQEYRKYYSVEKTRSIFYLKSFNSYITQQNCCSTLSGHPLTVDSQTEYLNQCYHLYRERAKMPITVIHCCFLFNRKHLLQIELVRELMWEFSDTNIGRFSNIS